MGDNTRAILSIFACISSIRKLEVSYFFGINIVIRGQRHIPAKGKSRHYGDQRQKFNIGNKMPCCTPGTSSEHFFLV